jgi:hypothetical protein
MTTSDAGMRGRWTKTITVLALVLAASLAVAPAALAGKRAITGTMTVDDGAAYATTTAVTLVSHVMGATQMRFQNAGGAWSSWESYAAFRSWTLVGADGQKTVAAQYRNGTSKTYTVSDTITLDTTAPVTTASTSSPAPPYVAVTLAPSDALSGVVATMYRVDGGAWQTGTSLLLCPGHKRASLHSGPHTIAYFSIDAVGNVEAVRSLIVTL